MTPEISVIAPLARLPDKSGVPEISVIAPLYNEAPNVQPLAQKVFEAFREEKRPIELILVDDRSTDATWQEILKARQADTRIRALRHQSQSGQSAALWTGFQASRGEAIATLDGDLQNDPADIPAVVDRIGDDVDCCCGYRANRMDKASRRVASRLANAVRNRALGESIIDTGCSIKAFKVAFVRNLQPWDGLHRFFTSFVAMQGGRICQIPVNHRPRAAGKSKYTNWRRLQKTLRDLRGVVWLKSRTRRYQVEER